MKDRLEKYIEENKAELDYRTPPDSAWKKIEEKLQTSSSPNYLRYWQAAAVIFFVVSIGLVLKNYQGAESDITVSETVVEFETTEEYYFDVIESQQGLLTRYLQQYPDLAADFNSDLAELSRNYNKLKKDFETTGDSQVLNALIQNLQLQQELLHNQLKIIQQIEEENENVSI